MKQSKLILQTHEVTKEFGLILRIFFFVLWLFFCMYLCFDFWYFHLLATDDEQAGMKECSVTRSVAQDLYLL